MARDEFETLYLNTLNEVCRLADRLLLCKFKIPGELWQLHLDTIELQTSFQGRITSEKADRSRIAEQIRALRSKSGEARIEKVRSLQHELENSNRRIAIYKHAYHVCRHFGDSFAWVLLGLDRQKVLSLSHNRRNPPPPTGVSLKGIIGAAQEIASQYGLMPVLHDMTDVLCVGDVSFLHPEVGIVTGEVKSTELGPKSGRAAIRMLLTESQQTYFESRSNITLGNAVEPADGKAQHRLRACLKR